MFLAFFFFNDTATTEIYTLSLHDALPISSRRSPARGWQVRPPHRCRACRASPGPTTTSGPSGPGLDRKSTRLNSSHSQISYAVFCLKKKKRTNAVHNICFCALVDDPCYLG